MEQKEQLTAEGYSEWKSEKEHRSQIGSLSFLIFFMKMVYYNFTGALEVIRIPKTAAQIKKCYKIHTPKDVVHKVK